MQAFVKICAGTKLNMKHMLIRRNPKSITSKFVEMYMAFTCLIDEVRVVSEMKFRDYDAPIITTFTKNIELNISSMTPEKVV